jgi:hypothetical protein
MYPIVLYCLSIHIATRVFLHEGMAEFSFWASHNTLLKTIEFKMAAKRQKGPLETGA